LNRINQGQFRQHGFVAGVGCPRSSKGVKNIITLPRSANSALADGPGQKLLAAGGFPFALLGFRGNADEGIGVARGVVTFALLGFRGNADGGEFVAVAVQPAGEPQAKGAGIELVGLAFAVQGDGRYEKALGTGGQEFAVEHETEAATFLHTDDLETFGDPLFDLDDE